MEFIDANTAKEKLGVDDATLENYVNNGTIRAKKNPDGSLQVVAADVDSLAEGSSLFESEDGTIVLSGDSEELQIDLDDIDDEAMTIAASGSGPSESSIGDTGTISFDDDALDLGDDLDLDSGKGEGNSSELSFDDADVTQDLSFTDDDMSFTDDDLGNQTEEMTGEVTEETDYDEAPVAVPSSNSYDSSRRSVRSQRVRPVAVKAHPFMTLWMGVTILIGGLFVAPYFVLSSVPREHTEAYNGRIITGSTTGIWADLAQSLVEFSVEPDKDRFTRLSDAGKEYIAQPDSYWVYETYLGADLAEYKSSELTPIDIARRYVIENISGTNGTSQRKNGTDFWLQFTVPEGEDPVYKTHGGN